MKISLLLLCVLLPVLARASDTVTSEILHVEQARIAALVADDYPALDQLLSADLSYAHSSTKVDTKTSFMESLRSGQLKYKSLQHRDQQVRVYGNTALLTGVTKVFSIAQGQEIHLTLRFLMVYVKQSNRWQLVAWQSTRVP